MKVPDRITADWLRAWGACKEQVAVVEREWPNGARPLLATARKAARLGLDVNWLARRLLPDHAWKEFERAEDELFSKYHRICDKLWEEWEELGRSRTKTPEDFTRACEKAWAELARECAEVLVRLWRAELAKEGERHD